MFLSHYQKMVESVIPLCFVSFFAQSNNGDTSERHASMGTVSDADIEVVRSPLSPRSSRVEPAMQSPSNRYKDLADLDSAGTVIF
jgi:hypothetical protein